MLIYFEPAVNEIIKTKLIQRNFSPQKQFFHAHPQKLKIVFYLFRKWAKMLMTCKFCVMHFFWWLIFLLSSAIEIFVRGLSSWFSFNEGNRGINMKHRIKEIVPDGFLMTSFYNFGIKLDSPPSNSACRKGCREIFFFFPACQISI